MTPYYYVKLASRGYVTSPTSAHQRTADVQYCESHSILYGSYQYLLRGKNSTICVIRDQIFHEINI